MMRETQNTPSKNTTAPTGQIKNLFQERDAHEGQVWPLRLNNPFSGRVVDYPDLGERTSIYRCLACRQPVNARDLGQVFHHETEQHQPIKPQLVCGRA